MRIIITIILFFVLTSGDAQTLDSAWVVSKYQQLSIDTGTYLAKTNLIDKEDTIKTLEDFKGKILYIGIWATTCGNSIIKFPYQEQLLKRLQGIHIDSSIQFINIHIEDSKKEWLKTIKKINPVGVNLFCSDTSILAKWNIHAPPAYILLDQSGKVLGKNIPQPDEAGSIDYILYSAIKGIKPSEAFVKQYQQGKLMEQHKSHTAINDEDYKSWFNLTINSFIEFQKWRKEHTKRF